MIGTIVVSLSVVFSLLATAVMSYIGMATPIGPWIASTLVLAVGLLLRLMTVGESITQIIALIVSCASIGGILATALGFSLPTLYFLNKTLFLSWLADPNYFILLVAGISFSAGLYGFWIADIYEERLLVQKHLDFPISQLLYRMICAHNQLKKAQEMVFGFIATLFFCVLQDGMLGYHGIIGRSIHLFDTCSFHMLQGLAYIQVPALSVDLFPSFWAIGYVTGRVIVLPLFIGLVSKIFLMDPIQFMGFSYLSTTSYVMAFCAGIICTSALRSLIKTPPIIIRIIIDTYKTVWVRGNTSVDSSVIEKYCLKNLLGILLIVFLFLRSFQFSYWMYGYLMIGTFICTYQVMLIAGRTGLALLGRFATFVMAPALVLFNVGFVQAVLMATFVEITAGVATDIMFGRKLGRLAKVSRPLMRQFQLLGLVIGSVSVGILFWLLISRFELGSAALFAQRAQARALLINVKEFDVLVLGIGFFYGSMLRLLNINTALVLGALLMPVNISLGLIIGGGLSIMSTNKEEWYPFWSGVFASSSMWMVIGALQLI
ncbi:hypothetical protein HOM50_01590 [bacterium]|nr:hypothetical protein [bacterium]MBT5015082.1 hypothetical protein [bacterium]